MIKYVSPLFGIDLKRTSIFQTDKTKQSKTKQNKRKPNMKIHDLINFLDSEKDLLSYEFKSI
jgi:hypothetical protein